MIIHPFSPNLSSTKKPDKVKSHQKIYMLVIVRTWTMNLAIQRCQQGIGRTVDESVHLPLFRYWERSQCRKVQSNSEKYSQAINRKWNATIQRKPKSEMFLLRIRVLSIEMWNKVTTSGQSLPWIPVQQNLYLEDIPACPDYLLPENVQPASSGYSGRKNMETIRLFINIVYISQDENRDWREILPQPFKSWIEGKCCHPDSNHKTHGRPFSEISTQYELINRSSTCFSYHCIYQKSHLFCELSEIPEFGLWHKAGRIIKPDDWSARHAAG
jgi:hypothetical protein